MDTEPRQDPPLQADERAALSAFLDFQRATLLLKAEGLTQEQLGTPAVPTSELTLAGLLKHLALVEDSWFQEVFLGQPPAEPWASAPWDDDRDWEFHTAPDDDPAHLVQLYRDAIDRSREVVAAADSLDELSVKPDKRQGTHAVLPAMDPPPHDRGDGPALRTRRPAPRGDRRADRGVTPAGAWACPGGAAESLREPAPPYG